MKLLEELLVAIFEMRGSNLLLCLLRTLEKMLEKLALLQQIIDTSQEHLAMEWLGDIRIGTMLITLSTMFLQILGCKHDDWDMGGCRVCFQLFGKLQTVHHRHHHITNHQIGHFLFGYLQSFFAIDSFLNDIFILQESMLILTDVVVIIDDQDGRAIGILAHQLLDFSTFPLSIVDILQIRLVYHMTII